MLRIAVQSKGRLYDETMLLLEEAGIKFKQGKTYFAVVGKRFSGRSLILAMTIFHNL